MSAGTPAQAVTNRFIVSPPRPVFSTRRVTLDWQPGGNRLTGTAVITANATQNLSRFDLDLRGFAISRLLVDSSVASFCATASRSS